MANLAPDEVITPLDGGDMDETDVVEAESYSPRDLAIKQFLSTLCRLEEIIDEEITCLESQGMPDFANITTQKIRLLRDVETRQEALLQFEDYVHEEQIVEKLKQLQPKLERNQYLLKLHLDAVGELVELLELRAVALEADGTYKADDCTAISSLRSDTASE